MPLQLSLLNSNPFLSLPPDTNVTWLSSPATHFLSSARTSFTFSAGGSRNRAFALMATKNKSSVLRSRCATPFPLSSFSALTTLLPYTSTPIYQLLLLLLLFLLLRSLTDFPPRFSKHFPVSYKLMKHLNSAKSVGRETTRTKAALG